MKPCVSKYDIAPHLLINSSIFLLDENGYQQRHHLIGEFLFMLFNSYVTLQRGNGLKCMNSSDVLFEFNISAWEFRRETQSKHGGGGNDPVNQVIIAAIDSSCQILTVKTLYSLMLKIR